MMAVNYKKEFGFTHHNAKKQLDNKFRTNRKEIENAMLWENDVVETVKVIKARMQAIVPIAKKITVIELKVSLNSLLTSIIHMTMNRWFRSKNRLHEMVIYEFLSRYYKSEIAKNNNTQNNHVS